MILVEMIVASKKDEGLQKEMEPILGASAMLGLLLMCVVWGNFAHLLRF
jgi:hypothetical protein